MATAGDTENVVERLARAAMADEADPAAAGLIGEFVRAALRESDPADLVARGEHDVLAALTGHWSFGRRRQARQTVVRVVAPDQHSRRWRSHRAAVMVITDDAPFLIDTLRMVLERWGLGIHLIVHPILRVQRDHEGVVVGFPERGGAAEAWTLVEIDRRDAAQCAELEDEIAAAVELVHLVVGDFDAMRDRVSHLTELLDGISGAHADEAHSAARLFDWLTRRNFVFLAAADREREGDDLRVVPGSELGLWSRPHQVDPPFPGDQALLSVARTDGRSPVHRPARLTCFSIRTFDNDGQVTGVRRVAGLFSAAAYRESVANIPLLREHVAEVNRRSGSPADSHSGRALRHTLESFPRDTLFEVDTDTLHAVVTGIVGLQDRHLVRVFAVVGPGARYATVMTYLPKVRFSAEVAATVTRLVAEHFDATDVEHDTRVGTGALARVTVTLARSGATCTLPDLAELAEAVDQATTTWSDRLLGEVTARLGEEAALALLDRFDLSTFGLVTQGCGIPPEYQASVDPPDAVDDLVRLARLVDDERGVSSALRSATPSPVETRAAERRLRVYFSRSPLPLSDLLPLLEQLGLVVVDERPHRFQIDDRAAWMFDIGVRLPDGVELTSRLEHQLHEVFADLVDGRIESDRFNRLVLSAGLTGRQVEVLRAYAKYLRQAQFPFSQAFMEDALARHPQLAADLVALFDARFDPYLEGHREILVDALRAEVLTALDAVPSIDDDRVGRGFLALIDATLRTNVYRRAVDGMPPPVMSFKLDPSRIPGLPRPLPAAEIWVCSPRVEGVHLRGGPIARGGLRWSDRREDFRTEVLGLMKAQMVKNAVIVPTGAKGGFVAKHPPADPALRREEGVACYRQFVAGMLDLTDNIVAGQVVPPADTVRYDGDDPYLVVAADKGTAAFSDIANEISAAYGFWLGDAFASGGSAGYDHKAMGITARGAWEAVRRHARALGRDADTDELTAVGIGDMSGDVFGNGMLLSPHLKLVAAFDHRHVFLDPDPEPAAAHAERMRLFALAGSCWADYAPSLISAGGGVHPRTTKSIRLSPEVRAMLDVTASSMAPHELISAILKAPVDLLWNGGVGTYVKASSEHHLEVGDRANDAVRVDACDLRCRIVAEGGNLGLTQRARVEYALGGGLVNTDAIDNSAGVDCSDHEVNVKITFDRLVADGQLTVDERNELLVQMTDDVAALVLDNNRAQTMALAIARSQALPMVNVHARYLQLLETEGWLDRALEFLPTDKELVERQASGRGLTPPEFAVMLAYTKWADVVEVLASDVPEDPYLMADLLAYFPPLMRDRFPETIAGHRLRREIIATQVVNQMVNLQGISFDHRMSEETGLPVAEVCRSWVVTRDVYRLPALWSSIDALGAGVPLDIQIQLFYEARRMTERATLWVLRRGFGRDIGHTITAFQHGIDDLRHVLDQALVGAMRDQVAGVAQARHDAGVPAELARNSAVWPLLHVGLDLVELSRRFGRPILNCAEVYWGIFDRLDLFWLWQHIGELPRADRWESQARSAVRDDLLGAMVSIAETVLATGRSAGEWVALNERPVERMRSILREIQRDGSFDLTTLTVAVRQLHNLSLTQQHERAPGLRLLEERPR